MSTHTTELQEGPIEGTNFELACSECGRIYHRMASGMLLRSSHVQLDSPVVPCHAGMLRITAPPLNPMERIGVLFGIKPKPKTFRATLHLLDGMLCGYAVEECS